MKQFTSDEWRVSRAVWPQTTSVARLIGSKIHSQQWPSRSAFTKPNQLLWQTNNLMCNVTWLDSSHPNQLVLLTSGSILSDLFSSSRLCSHLGKIHQCLQVFSLVNPSILKWQKYRLLHPMASGEAKQQWQRHSWKDDHLLWWQWHLVPGILVS